MIIIYVLISSTWKDAVSAYRAVLPLKVSLHAFYFTPLTNWQRSSPRLSILKPLLPTPFSVCWFLSLIHFFTHVTNIRT